MRAVHDIGRPVRQAALALPLPAGHMPALVTSQRRQASNEQAVGRAGQGRITPLRAKQIRAGQAGSHRSSAGQGRVALIRAGQGQPEDCHVPSTALPHTASDLAPQCSAMYSAPPCTAMHRHAPPCTPMGSHALPIYNQASSWASGAAARRSPCSRCPSCPPPAPQPPAASPPPWPAAQGPGSSGTIQPCISMQRNLQPGNATRGQQSHTARHNRALGTGKPNPAPSHIPQRTTLIKKKTEQTS